MTCIHYVGYKDWLRIRIRMQRRDSILLQVLDLLKFKGKILKQSVHRKLFMTRKDDVKLLVHCTIDVVKQEEVLRHKIHSVSFLSKAFNAPTSHQILTMLVDINGYLEI